MWRGGVSEHTRKHTPPPLSRGESHGPGFKPCLFSLFLIAKHVIIMIYMIAFIKSLRFEAFLTQYNVADIGSLFRQYF